MRHSAALRHRILTALMSSLVMGAGCKNATQETSESSSAQKPGARSAPSSPCKVGGPTERCYEPRTVVRGHPTGAPVDNSPPPAWDANGCAAAKEVTSSCCNQAFAGPKFKNGKCCYDICDDVCCGRPFIVAHAARVAPCVTRRDWIDHPVAPEPRSELARAWLDDALMEHASIASFSRFALRLMELGAPPALVSSSQQAALDEIAHARSCFALASRFAGRPLGPGPLDVSDAMAPSSLEQIAFATFREGCVGETIAALSARIQLEHARDAQVRTCLERIAEDEAQHAELAWQALGWMLGQLGSERQRVLAGLVDAATVDVPPRGDVTADVSTWHDFGRLLPAEAADLASAALRDVVHPALEALGAGHISPGSRTRNADTSML